MGVAAAGGEAACKLDLYVPLHMGHMVFSEIRSAAQQGCTSLCTPLPQARQR